MFLNTNTNAVERLVSQEKPDVKKRRSRSPYALRFLRRGEYAHFVDVVRKATSALCDMSVCEFGEWLGDQNNYQRTALQDKILCRRCAHLKRLSDVVHDPENQ